MGAVGATTAAPERAADRPSVPSANTASRSREKAEQRPSLTVAYVGCVAFVLIYCSRPYEWVPGMMLFPLAKIVAIVALAGFIPALIMKPQEVFPSLKRLRYLVLLFLQLSIAVPFAVWPGGSFETIFEEFSKVVLISLCASVALNTVTRLRRILLVQTMPVAVMVLVSVAGFGKVLVDSAGQVRMRGLVGGVFENPNDYAFSVALVFPVALTFMLDTRNVISKVFWAVTSLSMVYVVFQTLSRGGLLALVTAGALVIWHRGIREKRYALVASAALGILLLIGAAPDNFVSRVQSIVDFTKDETGSGWARRALLERAINIALDHPVLGVGPGNFQTFTSDWHGAHNTYAQLSAEAGFAAGLFFVLLLIGAIRTTGRVARAAADPQVRGLATALRVSLTCYAVGAFFADTGYHFFPYLFLGYAYCMPQLVPGAGLEKAEQINGSKEMKARSRRGEKLEQPALDAPGGNGRHGPASRAPRLGTGGVT